MATPDEQREALRRFMDKHELKAKPWCEAAGVTPNSIYNFLNGRSHSLSRDTLEKLAEVRLLPGQVLADILNGIYRSERIPRGIEVRGSVKAGQWREAYEWGQDDWYLVVQSVPKSYEKQCFALRVEGPSMNEIYPDGSIVFCVSLHDLRRDLKVGENVIIRRERRDGMIEATIKEFATDEDGNVWFIPHSTNPLYREAIPSDPKDDDVVSIEIVAVVIGSYKPEPNFPIEP